MTRDCFSYSFFFSFPSGFALNPTVDAGDNDDGKQMVQNTAILTEPKTVFENTKKRPLDKRKKEKNDDPSDIDGFLGPWACFKDEKRVMKPNEVCLSFNYSFLIHCEVSVVKLERMCRGEAIIFLCS